MYIDIERATDAERKTEQDQEARDITTEDALKELRMMFPTGYIEIAYGEDKSGHRYVVFEGASKERWTPKRCGESLADVMAQVRAWHKEQK